MTINGTGRVNMQTGQFGMGQGTDAYSRNIQRQIADAQKELQDLSANEDMTPEEKMKKRQEIQQKISELNIQLRQRQMEQRRAAGNHCENQKGSSMESLLGGSSNTGSLGSSGSAGLSEASMTAIISAAGSMKLARVEGSAAKEMKNRAGVLKAEIKQDAGRGGNVEKKQEELADIEQRAQAAEASQFSTLADVNKTVQEAAKADNRTDNKDNKDTDIKKKDVSEDTQPTETAEAPQPAAYTPVDIRL